DERGGEAPVLATEHREAHSVDGDRALLHQIGPDGLRRPEAVHDPVAFRGHSVETPDAVDVAEHDMTAEPVTEAARPFEVGTRAARESPRRRPAQRLR